MNIKNTPAYELILQQELPDIHSTGYLLRHKKSGARVMLLENDDDNKVFNIAFRTTPFNNTGVAHIMEHSVLCGSRLFPAKDPFVELVKGSMNTSLNAMTFSDKTMYPVASCNDTDFRNLMHVYLDAVFYPNIYSKEEIFRQEGWSYQIENPEDELVINGVVYNEMKGAFSSSEDVLDREIQGSLFPDITYGFESGGDPDFIPDLTYEEFLDFHRTYYHPSNSYIYLYGNMDMEERLNWMVDAYFSAFDACIVHSEIAMQQPFEQMVRVEKEYPVGAEESKEDATWLSYNTVVCTSHDLAEEAAFAVLEYALLEAPGAPLKQALLDAGIGSDILSSFDSSIQQPVFSIIARDASYEDQERFLSVIREQLEKIAQEGVDEKSILASLNIMEFKFREADFGSYPRGLIYGIDVFETWLYDDQAPFDALRAPEQYNYLRSRIGTGYFEELIRNKLLHNPHASMVLLRPKKGLTTTMEEALRKKLQTVKAGMDESQIQMLIEKTAKLRAFQETPSTKEELEAIPMLSREDLRKESLSLNTRLLDWDGVPVLYQDYNTYGIAYFSVLFDAASVPREELPWFGLLKNVLGMVDTERFGYAELFNEINLNTGGITPGISLYADTDDSRKGKMALGVKVRTMPDKTGYALDMIGEILLTSNLDMDKRLLEIIRKLVSRLETRLNSAGSATAASRTMSYFSWNSQVNEIIAGVDYYHMLQNLEEHFEEKKEEAKAHMRKVLQILLQPENLILIFTGEESWLPAARQGVEALRAKIAGQKEEISCVSGCGQKEDAPCTNDNGQKEEISCECDGEQKKETSCTGDCEQKTEMSCTNDDEQKTEALRKGTDLLREYDLEDPVRQNEGLQSPAKVQYVARGGNFVKDGFAYTGALRILKTILNYDYLWGQIRVIGGAYGCSSSFFRNGDTVLVSYRDPHLKRTMEVFEALPQYLEQFSADERDMTKYVIGTIGDLDTPLPPSALGERSATAFLRGLEQDRLQQERDQVLTVTVEDIRALAPMMQAVLDQQYLCVVGNEDKLRESQDLFMNLRSL
ncbi:MAG: insulinase family protein [Lachnospiraceae bacterium]|nr:insulinase family protein [Lachnospiraceae bacterium]